MNNYMGTVEYFDKYPLAYWLSLYLPIMIWLCLVLIFFVILLKKYTFGNWTEENKNPFDGETFQMPRGVFRGILTLTLLFVVIIIEIANVRIIGLEDEIMQLMVAFQMMIAFYFGSKVLHHVASVDRQKAEVIHQASTQISAGSDSVSDDFYDEAAQG